MHYQTPPAPDNFPESDNLSAFIKYVYLSTLRLRSFKIFLGVLLVLAGASSQIALVNILGYEFSAIFGVLIAHLTAGLTIYQVHRIKRRLSERSPFTDAPHPRIVVWGIFLGILFASLWMILIPLITIISVDLILPVRNCDYITGFGFYLTIPLISTILTISLAIFSSLATSSSKIAWLIYWFVIAIFVARIVCKLAVGHTIGMHDPLLGSFTLPLYEQETNITSGYLLSRLMALLFAKLLLNLSIMFADDHFKIYSPKYLYKNILRSKTFLPEIETTIFVLILLIAGFYFQGPLGIDITRRYLEFKLNGIEQTEHFLIHYPKGGEVEKDISRIAEEHEFYYWSIVKVLEAAPDGFIRAYIYPNRPAKTFLTGVGSSVYAKPWTGEIHVEYSRNKIDALEHELVHVISAPLGLKIFGSSLLGAYGEGIAEGVQWDSGNDLTYHQWASALRKAIDPYSNKPFFEREIAPERLLNRNFQDGGFYVGRTGMNYYLAASYNRWFIDTYGIDAYKKVYITNDTVAAVNKPREEIAVEWMNYLDHVPLTEDDVNFARFAFAPPKFVVRVCAHELAEHERLASEFSSSEEYSKAVDEYRILLDFSPANIRYGYRQAQLLLFLDKFDDALNSINLMRNWESADAGWQAYLDRLEGDIYAKTGNIESARQKYEDAKISALNESLEFDATLRLEMLDSPAVNEFLTALRDTKNSRWHYEKAAHSGGGWLAYYYIATDLLNNRDYAQAQDYFLRVLELNPDIDFIRRNSVYYLGICSYRLGDFLLASDLFTQALDASTKIFESRHPDYDRVIPINRLDSWTIACEDWLDRIEWKQSQPEK